jgi:two-component system, chemotaxis family, protein-glutamate methylesterase/glutaminase
MTSRVRVLVIDDSAYNRRTITKMLEEISGVEVISYACDGEEGLRKTLDLRPDLITLDLEMPRMDGFTFLRIIMKNRPTPVIVVSARSDDQNVFRALEFGAVEFVAKPTARISPDLFNIREDLERKVLAIAGADMNKVLHRPAPETSLRRLAPAPRLEESGIGQVVIGSSTGGPPALQAIFSAIQQPLAVGFAISQHMPPGFTRAFADRLNRFCALEVSEARHGDLMAPGRVLIAPGGSNLLFHRLGSEVQVDVVDPTAGQRYVPSADVMFQSAAEIYGPRLLGVVLTGMGNDGSQGVRRIKERGGKVLAEAEESSVVFGMPKEAIATGCVDGVVPLPGVCDQILRLCGY